jgi:ABC-type glycerol-3-phosphate transport system substrate-binding protein
MANRKVIFFILVGLLSLGLIYGIVSFAGSKKQEREQAVTKLSIWAVWGTTEEYTVLFEKFRETNKRYANITLDIRVFPNYESYREILLSTLLSGGGPDIFMIEGGGDSILESKSLPIPETHINLDNYEKRYEDIFLPLILSSWEGKELTRSLRGVAIGYETLWVFYNKSYFPSFPKTWSEISLTENSPYFVSNLGLGPSYSPDVTDIIADFLLEDKIWETKDIENGSAALTEYLSYGDASRVNKNTEGGDASETLRDARVRMDQTGLSTVDLFMQGEIGMIIGSPSTIREIEKAEKRAGSDAIDDIILTERLPRKSLWVDPINLARYRYFALRATSTEPQTGADFLSYLLEDSTQSKATEIFPYMISPLRSLAVLQGKTRLSNLFAQTKMDAFIPLPGEKLSLYNYGLKHEYEKIFREYLDRSDKIDTSNILSRLKKDVECKTAAASGGKIEERCLE